MDLTVKRSGGANGKARVLLSSVGFAASLTVFVALLEWTLEPTLVEWTARLAERYGALAASFSVLAGGGALFLLSWLSARRIEKRGLTV